MRHCETVEACHIGVHSKTRVSLVCILRGARLITCKFLASARANTQTAYRKYYLTSEIRLSSA